MHRRAALLALLGAVPFVRAASAQPLPTSPVQLRAMILMGGEFAMQTSQLALERARMPAVRNFAQLEINEQLGVAASLGGTPGATPLRPDQAALVQQLAALSGPRFDRMYVEGQVLGHEELLALNTTVLRSRADPTGVTVANLAVPSIQTHLRVLNRLQQGGMPV